MFSSSRIVLRALVLVALAAGAAADVLLLQDGRRIEGKIVEETPKEVRIKTAVGVVAFERASIVTIVREKTRDEIHDERLAACRTAEDFFQLGVWCEGEKLKKRAAEHYAKAIELDPDHAGAREKLGFVRHEGEWMTPAERDARVRARLEREMAEQGLVRHGESWVTPEDKQKLERGLVRVDGRWMTQADALAAQGLAEFRGERMPRERAAALQEAADFAEAVAGRVPGVAHHVGAQAALIGVAPQGEMQAIAAGLERSKAWFDRTFGYEGGLGVFGGRLPAFYVFGEGADGGYAESVDFVAARALHMPPGWPAAVKRTLGFTWIDPYPVSSARLGPRAPIDLAGHCYHHMGHLLAGRAGYDGRLLPPWYEEGLAGLCELRSHGTNRVFCRSSVTAPGSGPEGTSSGAAPKGAAAVDERALRDGSWREALAALLERGAARPFDKLAQLDFTSMELSDVAQSMAIVEWLESQDGALARFHRELRRGAPPAPERVQRDGNARQATYDAAFRAAAGMGFREADAAWKQWFLER